MQLSFIPCQICLYRHICIQVVVWPAARWHPWEICIIKVLQARPGCAPAIQTYWIGINSHLRPLVHPVGLPRKQALRSRLSPGPARGCVLSPMYCRPFMEMGSSRLLSLISTLQKSQTQLKIKSYHACTGTAGQCQKEENLCPSTPQHRKLHRGMKESIFCLHQVGTGPNRKRRLRHGQAYTKDKQPNISPHRPSISNNTVLLKTRVAIACGSVRRPVHLVKGLPV